MRSGDHNRSFAGNSAFTIPLTDFHVVLARGHADMCEQVLNTLDERGKAYLLNARINNGDYHLEQKPPIKPFLLSEAHETKSMGFHHPLDIPSNIHVELTLA